MPRFAVYHRVVGDRFTPFESAGFQLAATVEAPCLEATFQICNSIDGPWTENEEVLRVTTDFPRSLSVGDAVVDEEEYVHEVLSIGWGKRDPQRELPFVP